MFLASVILINFQIKHLIKVITVTVNEYFGAFSFLHERFIQAHSQKFAMGGCFGGLGAEPLVLKNFAFVLQK